MNKKQWAETIKDRCQKAGTYLEVYDLVIDQLAGIMEVKDTAEEEYEASGSSPVITYTNKGGHTNLRKNPALAVINECNQQALAYWRDLGLTPKGYKNLTGEAVDEKKGGTLEAMLKKLEI